MKVANNILTKNQLRTTLLAQRNYNSTFKADDVKIELSKSLQQKSPADQLVFGKELTDHWLQIEWNKEKGWGQPKISQMSNISLSPAAFVFHYASACFEGMKAYKDKQGKARLFRPMDNMKRLNNSSQRLCLPTFDSQELLTLIKKLVNIEHEWIPNQKGYSLYIRPTIIATQAKLGVNPPSDAMLFVILSPVGPYFVSGFKPISLYTDKRHVRAWPGGIGSYKAASNYAPTILPGLEAQKKGYSQILWLLNDKITEVGTMNLFAFWTNKKGKKELITAPLDGTILPGVTRQSILELSRSWNEFEVSERDWTIHELIEALNENRVIEVFGAGTAAIVAPIDKIHYNGEDYKIPCNNNTAGDLTKRFLETIQSIQYGEIESPWSVIC